MPKNDDLSFKPSRGPEQRDHEACHELQTIDHPAADYPIRGRKLLRMKFSVGTAGLEGQLLRCLAWSSSSVAEADQLAPPAREVTETIRAL
jgi:hypothetical protein